MQVAEANVHPIRLRPHAVALFHLALAGAVAASFASAAAAQDRLLKEAVEFTGAVTFVGHKVPGLVIGAVRNAERAVSGFGKTSEANAIAPDGKTILRIGSVTKAFAGAVLASEAVGGTVALTDLLEKHLGWDVKVPTRDGRAVRLIDLATHSAGFRRMTPLPTSPSRPSSISSGPFNSEVQRIGLLSYTRIFFI
jgi:D-alanyl-D-alanine-carboxypeptidase/D-alanyl-D-alanine-endopeptidase